MNSLRGHWAICILPGLENRDAFGMQEMRSAPASLAISNKRDALHVLFYVLDGTQSQSPKAFMQQLTGPPTSSGACPVNCALLPMQKSAVTVRHKPWVSMVSMWMRRVWKRAHDAHELHKGRSVLVGNAS